MRMMFFALAAWLVCVPAQAQNAFVEGEVDVISVTGCDTLEQANAGVEAWVSGGFMAFSNWMRTIGSERNSRQEPICGNTALPLAAVRTHSEHDVEHKGKMIKVWIVEFVSPLGPSLFVFSPKPSRPSGDPA